MQPVIALPRPLGADLEVGGGFIHQRRARVFHEELIDKQTGRPFVLRQRRGHCISPNKTGSSPHDNYSHCANRESRCNTKTPYDMMLLCCMCPKSARMLSIRHHGATVSIEPSDGENEACHSPTTKL